MRRGVAMGACAYVLWGLSALYWPLLEPATTVEVLAQRVVWSFVALMVLVIALGRWEKIKQHLRSRQSLTLLLAAAVLTTVNWGTFIWATTNNHVIDASMGYFIAPLVMVAIGVQAFHESPTRPQWLAVALGATGVIVLTIALGSPPWIAAVLAVTFAFYGWVKKQVGVNAVDGLAIETGAMLVPALIVVVYTQLQGTATFGHESAGHTALMVGASLVMLTPMLLFSDASNRIPLSVLGLMQYIEPVVQFLIGLVAFHETMPAARWMSFVLIWAAVGTLAYDAIRTATRTYTARNREAEIGVIP